jgi:hypothetical protein
MPISIVFIIRFPASSYQSPFKKIYTALYRSITPQMGAVFKDVMDIKSIDRY